MHKVMKTRVMAAQGMEILIRIAQSSQQDLLAGRAVAHGVRHLWGRREKMDLRSVGTFVQTTRKSRRRCMTSS
jgi:hypothetical protein